MSELKESILGSDDRPVSPAVKVTEWNVDVHFRAMTGGERDAFDTENHAMKLDRIRARMLVRTLCDADGSRIFKPEDADALAQKSGAVCDRLFDRAKAINGYGPEHEEALAKN